MAQTSGTPVDVECTTLGHHPNGDGVADLDTTGSYREAFQHVNFLQIQI
jgi:hypothetical protein